MPQCHAGLALGSPGVCSGGCSDCGCLVWGAAACARWWCSTCRATPGAGTRGAAPAGASRSRYAPTPLVYAGNPATPGRAAPEGGSRSLVVLLLPTRSAWLCRGWSRVCLPPARAYP